VHDQHFPRSTLQSSGVGLQKWLKEFWHQVSNKFSAYKICSRKQNIKIGSENETLHDEDLSRIPVGKEVKRIISVDDQSVHFQLGDHIKLMVGGFCTSYCTV